MTLSTQPLPSIGAANATEDPKVRSLLSELQGIVNGGIDSTNLAAAAGVTEAQLAAVLATRLGLGSSGRGKTNIATTEARANTAYGTLTTPDKVTVTLPTDGLVAVAYQATWQESVVGAARAAIFVGATQLKGARPGQSAPLAQEAQHGSGTTGQDVPLASYAGGLSSISGSVASAYGGDVTTGQVIGGGLSTDSGANVNTYGPCFVFAAAGTYDITVQYKASSGSVTAKNRKLWAWTLGF